VRLLGGKHRDASEGLEFEFVRSDRSVELLVPLADMDEQVVCWVCFGYRIADPLVAEISIRSPSKAPVVERTLLRTDFRRFARTGGEIPGLSIQRRPDGEHLTVSFYEGDLAIPAVIPVTAVAAYLSETEELVSFDPSDEARALDRAFMELLKGSAPRT
jgi:hypothetical protein